MVYLLITSLLWALSFGLVKGQLTGVDAIALSTLRMAISTVVFLPLLRAGRVPWAARGRLALIGAVQFGLMYIFYLKSFVYLQAFEVALYTIFTPLYVVFIDALFERHWSNRYLFAALLAAAGAAIVQDFQGMTPSHWSGFLLLQASNLCFALGQLLWRREHQRHKNLAKDSELFAIPYAGGLLATALASLAFTDWAGFTLSGSQILSLAYLGVVASGLCFFLWNVGAERVNAGLLAVMNNVKIPVAVAISLLVFNEKADLPRLLVGGAVLGLAVWVSTTGKRDPSSPTQSTSKS